MIYIWTWRIALFALHLYISLKIFYFFQFVSKQPSKINMILGTDASPNQGNSLSVIGKFSESWSFFQIHQKVIFNRLITEIMVWKIKLCTTLQNCFVSTSALALQFVREQPRKLTHFLALMLHPTAETCRLLGIFFIKLLNSTIGSVI